MKQLGDKIRTNLFFACYAAECRDLSAGCYEYKKNSNKLRKQLSNFVEENSTGHY